MGWLAGGCGGFSLAATVITGRIPTYTGVGWPLVNSWTDRSYLVYCQYLYSLRTYSTVYYLSTLVVYLSTLFYIITSLLEIRARVLRDVTHVTSCAIIIAPRYYYYNS